MTYLYTLGLLQERLAETIPTNYSISRSEVTPRVTSTGVVITPSGTDHRRSITGLRQSREVVITVYTAESNGPDTLTRLDDTANPSSIASALAGLPYVVLTQSFPVRRRSIVADGQVRRYLELDIVARIYPITEPSVTLAAGILYAGRPILYGGRPLVY